MIDTPATLAIAPCYACGNSFAFDPDTVPAIPIDLNTNLPSDLVGADPANAVNRPLCDPCLAKINPVRIRNGRPPFTHGRRLEAGHAG